MKVRFEMSGGYGGLYAAEPLTAEVDAESLPEKDRVDVVQLATAAMAASPIPNKRGSATDLMTYRLEITGDEHRVFVLDDRTVPEEMSPLIDYMRNLAIQSRLDQQ